MTLYFISGLGTDERVFNRLRLPDNIQIRHVVWPIISPTETLHSYCEKIISQIDTLCEFGVVGLSFGGILATEISKLIHPTVTILLSSVTTSQEIPLSYRIIGKLKLNTIVPRFLLNKVYPFTYWYFGVTDPPDKKLLKSIIHTTPTHFLTWALNEIVNWDNSLRPENIFHIHGDSDKLFPVSLTKADKIITNAGHFMVHTHSQLVSQAITEYLGKH